MPKGIHSNKSLPPFYIYYLKSRILLCGILLYLIVAIFVQLQWHINMMPPCLSMLLLGKTCPGCGLTRSGFHLLHLDFAKAYETNPLIFIIIPLLVYAILRDIQHQRKRYRHIQKGRRVTTIIVSHPTSDKELL